MNKRYEHRIEHVAIPFKSNRKGAGFFASDDPILEPDLTALLEGNLIQGVLAPLGADGWTLVSLQPVCRAEIKIGNHNAQGWAYGFPMPTGYLLFLQRERL
ncbi:hypothetical protein [Pseudomonas guariconensis]|uniref:hypothetical protein n=1 Tax=Pseudomonas guariconensis TaxID=1288410 RepID=UPI0018D947BD|nr:hypothetical protein [Pseudomonas guariconensis]MBH3361334.1 hypothetical protein [Pseudomonas guariconensis]